MEIVGDLDNCQKNLEISLDRPIKCLSHRISSSLLFLKVLRAGPKAGQGTRSKRDLEITRVFVLLM
jgi:hypothetical protein